MPIPLFELLRQIETEDAAAGVRRERRVPVLMVGAAVLAGWAAGWEWLGLRLIAAAVLDPLPDTATLLAVVALVAAAFGPWLPMRFLPTLARWIEAQRQEGKHARMRPGLTLLDRIFNQRDETLFWAAAAILSAAAGALVLMTLVWVAWAESIYRLLLERFFWTSPTLAAVETLGTAVVVGPLCVLNSMVATGMVLAGARRLSLRDAVLWMTGAWALGFAVAGVTHPSLVRSAVSADQQLVMAVAPMFAAALLLSILAHRTGRGGSALAESSQQPAPAMPRGDRWIRRSSLAWAVASGLACVGWLECRLANAGWIRGGHEVAVVALSFAAGLALGGVLARGRIPAGPGCGMAVWLAGLGTGAAATLSAQLTAAWSGVLQMATLAVPAGFTWCYIHSAWLYRAAGRGVALTRLAVTLLAGLGAAVIAGRWLLLPLVGPAGLWAAGALLMLTFGGVAQIYEDPGSGRRHLRLGLVFASLAGAMALFPSNVREWSGRARQAAVAPARVDARWLAGHAPKGARRFCLIGADLSPAAPAGAFGAAPWMVTLSFSYPATPVGFIPGAHDQRVVVRNACRALRMDSGTYDVIYQCGPLLPGDARYPGYSREWLGLLARRRAPGGRVILDIPLAGFGSAAAAVVARGFEQIMGPASVCAVVNSGAGAVLRLQSNRDPPDEPGSEAAPVEHWQPISVLPDKSGGRAHTLRRNRLSGLLHAAPAAATAWDRAVP